MNFHKFLQNIQNTPDTDINYRRNKSNKNKKHQKNEKENENISMDEREDMTNFISFQPPENTICKKTSKKIKHHNNKKQSKSSIDQKNYKCKSREREKEKEKGKDKEKEKDNNLLQINQYHHNHNNHNNDNIESESSQSDSTNTSSNDNDSDSSKFDRDKEGEEENKENIYLKIKTQINNYISKIVDPKNKFDLKLNKHLGSGSFGDVFSGSFGGKPVAIKIENVTAKNYESSHKSSLWNEYNIYSRMHSNSYETINFKSKPIDCHYDVCDNNNSYLQSNIHLNLNHSNNILKISNRTTNIDHGLPNCLFFHSTDEDIKKKKMSGKNQTQTQIKKKTERNNDNDNKDNNNKEKTIAFRIMVLPILGTNLETLQENTREKKLSNLTVLQIGYQLLSRLEYIHSKGIVHKDIKPANIMTFGNQGIDQGHVTFMDFGMSKLYVNHNNDHIGDSKQLYIEGTTRYMSISTHQGRAPTRKDDLQSLAYTLIYMLKGSLPWQGVKPPKYQTVKDKDGKIMGKKELIFKHDSDLMNWKRDKILALKKSISTSKLCNNLPSIFELFLKYSLRIKYNENPDYEKWKNKFWKTIMITSQQSKYYNHIENDNDDVDDNDNGNNNDKNYNYKMDWM